MRRRPVHDDADPRRVAGVDEGLEALRIAVARGRGEIARALVAPGVVQGVFRHGHELDMRKAHFLDVRDQVPLQPAVGGHLPVRPPPGARVHLVDVQRRVVDLIRPPVIHPLPVRPAKAVGIKQAAGRAGALFRPEAVGIRLPECLPVAGVDGVFVVVARVQSVDLRLPEAVRELAHHVDLRRPGIKIPHHRDEQGIRSPDAKDGASFRQTGTERGVRVILPSGIKGLSPFVGDGGQFHMYSPACEFFCAEQFL